MSEKQYDVSRKGLIKGLNASSIDELGKPINYSGSERECDDKTYDFVCAPKTGSRPRDL